ncbi:MAG TPA: MFS transporter [Candidatus Sulfotelmatobacter sp.]|nr:MFS transporter [Candidatus Sulfotelmatobacter sp.]
MSVRARATSVRWRVVLLLAVTAGLTYIDRLNLGVAGKYIQDEFKFNTQTMGWILGAFSLGYALFHVPGGWLADRFGARRVLAVAILWFSIFTAATAIAPSLPFVKLLGAAWAFVIVRFVMGLGEAAAMPVGNKMMAYWLSEKERAFGTSVFLAGVGAGGIAAPFVITWIVKGWGWRAAFISLGAIGVAVAAVWYAMVTDRPEEHSDVNGAELAIIGNAHTSEVKGSKVKVPWGRLLSSSSMWGLMISHFCLVYPVYIFFTWFFIYLVRVRGVTISKASLWTSAPFAANLVMVPLWGWLSDYLANKIGKRQGRRVAAWLGIGCSALLLFSGSHTSRESLALLQLALAAGFNFAASAVLWTTCNDISAKCSGSISGIMTTFGSLGGWLSPVVTGAIAAHFGWSWGLDFAALVTVISGLAWFLVDAEKCLE